MIENPNEYNEEAYQKAMIPFATSMAAAIDDLWNAGADADDIIDEINNALDLTDSLNVLRLVVEE